MKLNVEFRGEIPEDWVAIDSVAVVKCLDSDGDPVLCVRSSNGLSPWEAVGMLAAASDTVRSHMGKMFEEGDGNAD